MQNEKDIIVGQEESAAMYLKNNAGEGAGIVINETPNGKIDLDVKSTVGIFVDKSTGKNKNIIKGDKLEEVTQKECAKNIIRNEVEDSFGDGRKVTRYIRNNRL